MTEREKITRAVVKQCKDAGFVPDIAFTLTLDLNKGKEKSSNTSRKTTAEKLYQKWHSTDIYKQQELYDRFEQMFKKLYGRMAKKCYGSNCKRLAKNNPDKELKMFASTERGKHRMFHLHGTAVLPNHINFNKFKRWLLKIWSSFFIGSNKQSDFQKVTNADEWISYISKDFHKDNSMGYISYSKI